MIGVENLRTICTSHVERNNLTIRTFMKRFTRLSLGFSKKLENLAAAVALHVAYFNYCWRSRENTGGRQRLTPAMQAGIVRELWGLERLYDEVIGVNGPRLHFSVFFLRITISFASAAYSSPKDGSTFSSISFSVPVCLIVTDEVPSTPASSFTGT